MILFRGLAVLTFWYIVYILKTPFFFILHEYGEQYCIDLQERIRHYTDVYVEHPLYIITLIVFGLSLYALGKAFDTTFGLLSVLGITLATAYFLFF